MPPRDANGAELTEGGSVTLIKDLKVKGLVLRTEFVKRA